VTIENDGGTEMTNRLSDLTVEHLGQDATDQDLEEFKGYVIRLMARDGLSESDAIDAIWGDGDYLSNAKRLGL
jgi:hypothetical protein